NWVGAALATKGAAIVAEADGDEPVEVSARAAARPNAPADPYRSSGCLAIPRATTSSRATGTCGLIALGRGGGADICAPITCSKLSARNGVLPVTASHRTHANAYTSTADVASSLPNRS